MTRFLALSEREAAATQLAPDILRGVPWASQLVAWVADGGGLSTANMPLLFEARCGPALHDCGIAPEYEYPTGVGETTVDFSVWALVELYSLDEREALKGAGLRRHPRLNLSKARKLALARQVLRLRSTAPYAQRDGLVLPGQAHPARQPIYARTTVVNS
jgi:hypothetical protein